MEERKSPPPVFEMCLPDFQPVAAGPETAVPEEIVDSPTLRRDRLAGHGGDPGDALARGDLQAHGRAGLEGAGAVDAGRRRHDENFLVRGWKDPAAGSAIRAGIRGLVASDCRLGGFPSDTRSQVRLRFGRLDDVKRDALPGSTGFRIGWRSFAAAGGSPSVRRRQREFRFGAARGLDMLKISGPAL